MEDQINLAELHQMKLKFDAADEDGSDGIEMDEFIEHFGDIVGKSLSDLQLKQLFMKIDADSNGSVDWDEFTNFMFLKRQTTAGDDGPAIWTYGEREAADVNAGEPHANHKDVIVAIAYVGVIDRYVTGSRDGTFRLFHASDFQHAGTFRVSGETNAWVTDVSVVPSEKRTFIAVAASDRTVSFYAVLLQNKLTLAGRYALNDASMGAPTCATAVPLATPDAAATPGASADLGAGNASAASVTSTTHPHGPHRFMWGDSGGTVRALMCDYVVKHERDGTYGHTRSVAKTDWMVVHEKHTDACVKLMHVPELECVVSASNDGTIVVVDVSTVRLNSFRVKMTLEAHPKGVLDFDYCPAHNVFASCGIGRDVMLWHGSTGNRLGILKGHVSTVCKVCVDVNLQQVVSVYADKTIKVWDLRNNRCVQTMEDACKKTYRPEDRIAVVTHDPRHRRLITGTTRLRGWCQTMRTREDQGHNHAVVGCLYNDAFDVAVSADESGEICVWNVSTGARDGKFNNAHAPGARITAMTFDTQERRLLTGANDGGVRMHNHDNGQLLKEMFHDEGKGEVTAVLHAQDEIRDAKIILAAGWNHLVIAWNDTEDSELREYWVMRGHEEDILCAAYCANTVWVATGDYGGKIMLWNLYSGARLATWTIECEDDHDSPCEKLLFLQTRRDVKEGPVLISGGADGNVRAWLAMRKGRRGQRPIAIVNAAASGEAVAAMKTDPTDTKLFVGDSAGHVRVFDIENVLRDGNVEDVGAAFVELGAWRPHKRAIASVEYMPARDLLVLSSVDAECTLWTLEGAQIGVFGQATPWRATSVTRTTWKSVAHKRRVGGGDTSGRPWRLDEMADSGPGAAASKKAKHAEMLKALLRSKSDVVAPARCAKKDAEAPGVSPPALAAATYLKERKERMNRPARWADFETCMVHGKLRVHELRETPETFTSPPKRGTSQSRSSVAREDRGRMSVS